jgi:predicted amidophosphoribosyltransferase
MSFEALAIAGHHKGLLRRAIVQWKYSRCVRLEPILVSLLSDTLARQQWHKDVEAFVPIPQPWPRWLSRWFSWPVRDLAIGVGAARGTGTSAEPADASVRHPVWPALRARRHRPQVGLSYAQRLENTRDVFYVPANIDLSGRRLCLIDDVSTTGATLNCAAKALRRAGAEHVWSLVLAKT